jgi:hypothetical protein
VKWLAIVHEIPYSHKSHLRISCSFPVARSGPDLLRAPLRLSPSRGLCFRFVQPRSKRRLSFFHSRIIGIFIANRKLRESPALPSTLRMLRTPGVPRTRAIHDRDSTRVSITRRDARMHRCARTRGSDPRASLHATRHSSESTHTHTHARARARRRSS